MEINSLKTTGEVHLFLTDSKGLVYKKYPVENNLVVALGKENVAKLLGGDSAGLPITQVQAGSSNTAATDADTTITSAVTVSVSGVTYPSNNQVKFEFTFTGASLGGMVVKELGLLNSGDVLCARKVTADLSVPTGLTLTGYWIITINN